MPQKSVAEENKDQSKVSQLQTIAKAENSKYVVQRLKPQTAVDKHPQRTQSAQPRSLKQEVKQIKIYSEKEQRAGKSIPKADKTNAKKETVQPPV